MDDLSGFQRDILRTVAASDDDLHGLGIKTRLQDEYETDINHGRLYPNLDDLVNMGLLNKSQRDKRTNEYVLTKRGQSEVNFIQGKWAEAEV